MYAFVLQDCFDELHAYTVNMLYLEAQNPETLLNNITQITWNHASVLCERNGVKSK